MNMKKLLLKKKEVSIDGHITFYADGKDTCTALLTINGERKYFMSERGSVELMDKIRNYIFNL